ncbi:MAG: response regulator [Gemmatimonadaceae bacterium]
MAHILVIDDDNHVRRALRSALERDGHAVSEAASGSDGLKMLVTSAPQLVITDILMPGGDGIEFLLAIRRSRPTLPVIAASGGSARLESALLLESAEALGATRILPKPFILADLRAAVADALALPRPRNVN